MVGKHISSPFLFLLNFRGLCWPWIVMVSTLLTVLNVLLPDQSWYIANTLIVPDQSQTNQIAQAQTNHRSTNELYSITDQSQTIKKPSYRAIRRPLCCSPLLSSPAGNSSFTIQGVFFFCCHLTFDPLVSAPEASNSER